MRVLIVSALFPQTSFTGGTKVPLAQAVALRALGHEVQLFGGYLSRVPGQATETTQMSGIPARLVDVAGRLDPESPTFFANAAAEREFRKVLETGFDVAHFHSLQGLGAGLVSLARTAGLRTVVQMHDFYWVCDRQFLVTRGLQACAGPGGPGCLCPEPSGGGHPRMTDLNNADLVLVPTQQMALWLTNLGLVQAQFRVAGWPPAELPEPTLTTLWPISAPYILYLGGLSGEKGWPTVLLAAWGDKTETLRVLCPGVDQRSVPGELQGKLIGGHTAPRAEISLLMRRAHGVVVPSIAAETFSYVAREALGLGVPVVITDGPGGVDCWRSFPESVQLVPRGRPDHLRTAMLELLGRQRSAVPGRFSTETDLGQQLVDLYSAIGRGRDRGC